MTKKTALQTVQAFHHSITKGTDEWKEILATDVTFISPVNQVSGREANIKLNESFFPLIKSEKNILMIAQDNVVATRVEFIIRFPSDKEITLEMAEFYEVRNEQIKSIRVYYDPEALKKEFGKTG